MLTTSSLSALRNVPIEDVIGHYIKLKKRGGKYISPCPFHNEKTPSFNVNPAKNYYKCFGCGAGGDAVRFIEEHQRLDFLEAAEAIAEIGGITLEHEENFDREQYVEQRKQQRSLREMMVQVQALYSATLYKPEGAAALAYLRDQRGYDEETIAQWGFGYADCNNDVTALFLRDGSLPNALRVSLVEEKGQHEDFFQSRLTIPMLNPQGDVVGFAGRTLRNDKSEVKYKNSSTNELYNKSAYLFGLYQAAKGIRDLGFITLAEGQLDVVGLHRAGLTNAVGTCGTALTDDQLRLLKRYSDSIMLMRDSDKAGIAAMTKDLPKLLKAGFKVDVMPLPDGQDPDDFAKQLLTTAPAIPE